RLGLPAAVPLAVCVGRLTRQKGQDVLVAAWPAVAGRCPSARLAIVGDGEDRDRLAGRPVPGVLFVPAVQDPRDWLAAANVIVLPSRWEGLPLTALEALATGRCIVGTDIPGLAEVVRPGVGALVPVDEPEPLAEAMAARLLFPGVAEEEGRAAAAAAAAFDVTGTMELLAAVTREVLGGAEPPDERQADGRAAGEPAGVPAPALPVAAAQPTSLAVGGAGPGRGPRGGADVGVLDGDPFPGTGPGAVRGAAGGSARPGPACSAPACSSPACPGPACPGPDGGVPGGADACGSAGGAVGVAGGAAGGAGGAAGGGPEGGGDAGPAGGAAGGGTVGAGPPGASGPPKSSR
ncbi:glycosyltransferase family 4 protein, partial [Actinomadura roseirufa]|uniref:glycosyltransferase family 4 protein n=1 Tax=Actinomadura roseirufa TaxID=2094049 RepID=UPI001041AA24